jgi:hypothetical protein
MPNSSTKRWILPGKTSSYLIVWPSDEAAKDIRRHVPPEAVLQQLARWLSTRPLILQEIDEALGGAPQQGRPTAGTNKRNHQIQERIANAFREGRVIALQAEPTRDRHQHQLMAHMSGPGLSTDSPQAESMTPLQTQMTVVEPADPSDPWSFLEPFDQAHSNDK